jgi:hypothetical protein
MKLNPRTTQILKNFASINPSLQFDEGQNLKTISPNKTVMAQAKLDDVIPRTFAIYDLSRFLGVVSLFEDPSFNFEDTQVNLSSAGRKVSYTYADPSTIITPPNKEIDIGNVDVEVEINQEVFAEIMKAMGVLGFSEVVLVGEDGKLKLRATDTKNPSADNFDVELGDTDMTFSAVFKSENLKIIPANYTVRITSRGISHWSADDVEYWISIESNSEF